MPLSKRAYRAVHFLIAFVWIINGLFCKVLNLVPRHEQIVRRILGTDHSRALTVLIGVSEILMALWIMSGIKRRMSSVTQIILVVTMNALEFVVAPDLLLWGRANALFALAFVLVVYMNERSRHV